MRLVGDDESTWAVVTRTDGAFDFGVRDPAGYTVSAQAPGLGPAAVRVDLLTPKAALPSDAIELELTPCDAALYGTVGGASGAPVAAARVRLMDGVQAESGGDGSYQVCVKSGYTVVEATADGYAPASAHIASVRGRVRHDFRLVAGSTVVGRVERPDGLPLPAARVTLHSSRDYPTSTTDETGRFVITNIAPGRYEAFAVAGGYASEEGTPVVVRAHRPSSEIVCRVVAVSTVRGTIVEDGLPVAGAPVHRLPKTPWHDYVNAVSGPDGAFVLSSVPRGEMTLSVHGYDVVRPKTLQVDGPELAGILVEVDSLAVLRGRVVRGQAPAPRALVRAHAAASFGVAETDGEGRFEIGGLRAGTYRVSARSDAEDAQSRDVTVTLADREVREGPVLVLLPTASVAGVVVDEGGAPLGGVHVRLWHRPAMDEGSASTDENGMFSVNGLRPNVDYQVEVRPASDSPGAFSPAQGKNLPPIRIPDDATRVDGVRLVVRGNVRSIAGTVFDARGAPVPDVRIRASGVSRNYLSSGPDAITNSEGAFRIEQLAAGSYSLDVWSGSGTAARVSGVAAGRQDVVVTLPDLGGVEGALVGFREVPSVSAQPAAGSLADDARGEVHGGGFRIPGLVPGRYTVVAATPAEADSVTVDVKAGETARVTLTSHGSASVRGRVLEFPGGSPVPDMRCSAWPDRVPPSYGTGIASDPEGRFHLPVVPAGRINVWCNDLRMVHALVRVRLTLAAGETATVELRTTRRGGFEATIGAGANFDGPAPVLESVDAGGPADRAGLRNGDVLVLLDGVPVAGLSGSAFGQYVCGRPVGSVVQLTVRRDGQERTAALTVAQRRD